MTGTTISTFVGHTVDIGMPSYPAPLTISHSGTISPSALGAAGLISTLVPGASIINDDGIVLGAAGSLTGTGGTALIAGDGAIIYNIGLFEGGTGGTVLGPGGTGIYIYGSASFTNGSYTGSVLNTANGTVSGGSGSDGAGGGPGGTGAVVHNAYLNNLANALIIGGTGRPPSGGGTGGTGLVASGTGSIGNSGTIIGGAGLLNSSINEAGGMGVSLSGSVSLINHGLIAGGSQAAGATAGGGMGGTGLSVSGVNDVQNYGTIRGGSGGTEGGGTGFAFSGSGTIENWSIIDGGAGSFSNGPGGSGGTGILFSGSGAVENWGIIEGGGGGNFSNGSGGGGGAGIALSGSGTVENRNKIEGGNGGNVQTGGGGNGGAGISFSGGGTAGNIGTISGGNGGSAQSGVGGSGGAGFVLSGSGTAGNWGTIEGGDGGSAGNIGGSGGTGLVLTGTGLFTNDGIIDGGNGGTSTSNSILSGHGGAGAYLSSGTLVNAGTIAGGKGGEAVAFGSQAAVLIIDPHALFEGTVAAQATVADTLVLSGSVAASLAGIGTQFQNFSDIDFAAGAHWRLEGTTAGLASGASIAGFALGDSIVLDSFTATEDSFGSGGLVLGSTTTLGLTGAFSAADFIVTSFAGNTTVALDAMVICYLAGTRILTEAGEVAVEDLRIGDAVAARFGGLRRIKWIGRQSFAGRFARNNPAQVPVRIAAGALGEGVPRRDLFVSSGHSMLLGEVLVLARDLVNGVTIRQEAPPEALHYYQLELETHDCVLAEGAWSETYADAPGMRNAFHNAAEFWHLYPEHVPVEELALCAARPQAGAALEAALRPVAARAAGLAPAGALQGWVEEITGAGYIRGWAYDAASPDLPVLLEVLRGGRPVHSLLARDYRGDLAAAGYGAGCCGFALTLEGLRDGDAADISLRRAVDGAVLPRTHEFRAHEFKALRRRA